MRLPTAPPRIKPIDTMLKVVAGDKVTKKQQDKEQTAILIMMRRKV